MEVTKFNIMLVSMPSHEEVRAVATLLKDLTSLLDTQDELFHTIWPDQSHTPGQPNYFLTKYRGSFQGNATGMWYYLDTPSKRALYSWYQQQRTQLKDMSCEDFHSAACFFILLPLALNQPTCYHMWGGEQGMTHFNAFVQNRRNPVLLYQSLSPEEQELLYDWAVARLPNYFPCDYVNF